MTSKKCLQAGIWTALLSLWMLAGCVTVPATAVSNSTADSEIAVMKGSWQPLSRFEDDAVLQDVYDKNAAAMPYYSKDGLKAAVHYAVAAPVIKAIFDGSTTVAFTIRNADGSEKEVLCEYTFKGTKPMAEDATRHWLAFEAVKPIRELKNLRYFVVTAPQIDEKTGIKSFDARFGKWGIQSLVHGDPLKMAPFVDANLPKDEVLKQFTAVINTVAAEKLPKEPLALYNGKWVNSVTVCEDPRPAIQNIYTQLIKEFAGKNPKGGDYTKEDIMALVYKAFGTADDFTHLEFIAGNGKNEIIVWKGDKEVTRSPYIQDGAHTAHPSYRAFSATDPAFKGKLAHFSITIPHAVPPHMHPWYGTSIEEAAKMKSAPTCIRADVSEEEMVQHVLDSCRSFLKGSMH